MDDQKRDFLGALAALAMGAPIALFARGAWARQQGMGHKGANQPGGIIPEGAGPTPPGFDPKKIQEHNQKVILDDIQKLYKLAGELKDEVEKTDSTSTLSLSMVQKAKEVEKLAKQIANLAVG